MGVLEEEIMKTPILQNAIVVVDNLKFIKKETNMTTDIKEDEKGKARVQENPLKIAIAAMAATAKEKTEKSVRSPSMDAATQAFKKTVLPTLTETANTLPNKITKNLKEATIDEPKDSDPGNPEESEPAIPARREQAPEEQAAEVQKLAGVKIITDLTAVLELIRATKGSNLDIDKTRYDAALRVENKILGALKYANKLR